MSLDIQIEVLPEPELIFASGKSGVEPRPMMMRYGAADKSPGKDIRLGIVGASAETQLARQWLVHLNLMSVATRKTAGAIVTGLGDSRPSALHSPSMNGSS